VLLNYKFHSDELSVVVDFNTRKSIAHAK
jgi:hypothetical protein